MKNFMYLTVVALLLSGCEFYSKSVCLEIGPSEEVALEGKYRRAGAEREYYVFEKTDEAGVYNAVVDEEQTIPVLTCVAKGKVILEAEMPELGVTSYKLVETDQGVNLSPLNFDKKKLKKGKVPHDVSNSEIGEFIKVDNSKIATKKFVKYLRYTEKDQVVLIREQ